MSGFGIEALNAHRPLLRIVRREPPVDDAAKPQKATGASGAPRPPRADHLCLQ